jgi:epoxyqueuosine reductase
VTKPMTDQKHSYQGDMVDDAIFRRFPQRLTVFERRMQDPSAIFYKHSQDDESLVKAKDDNPGYTRVEFAMASAAWTVAQHFHGAYSGQILGSPHFMLNALGQHKVEHPAKMTEQINSAARIFGAALVGVSAVDSRWIYGMDGDDTAIAMLRDMKYAVVMAISMDAGMILQTPHLQASIATGVGYSRMAVVATSLAQFIRHLGYQAIAMGNDSALSIPIAIDAGLGQLGRNGLLVTKECGPCVRLCKVFTDIPLVADTPVETGLLNFCESCMKCAKACPGRAISFDEEPSYRTTCPSNNPGIKRWAVNADLCYQFWMENGNCCSSCIAACPFTQRVLRSQKK